MARQRFQHVYHDAELVRFAIGPRRDVVFEFALDPVWNQRACTVRVRFGAIQNFEAVAAALRLLPAPRTSDAFQARVLHLSEVQGMRGTVEIAFDGVEPFEIQSDHVTEEEEGVVPATEHTSSCSGR